MTFLGPGVLTYETTQLCDTLDYPNEHVDLAANTFTAPRDCVLEVSFSMLIGVTEASYGLFVRIQVEVDGVSNLAVENLRNFSPSEVSLYPVAMTGVLSVPAGAVVGLRLTAGGGGSGFTFGHVSFSGIAT